MKNVIFGSGPLAWWVMQTLVENGDSVSIACRSGKINKPLADGVTIHACDATKANEVAEICKDARVVYFCAMPPYTNWPDLFPPLVTGFLKGAAETNAKLVFGDNLYMYGPANGQALTESLPHAAEGHKGMTRARVAHYFMGAHERGDNVVSIGRTSDFFGPYTINAVLGEVFFEQAFKGGAVNLLGNIDQPHTFSYIKDFAQGLVTLGKNDAANGEAWHTPTAPAVSTREMVELIEDEMGRKIKRRVAGKTLISLVGLFNPLLKEVKEMMYTWEQPYIVDHSKFEKAFGLNVTSHKEGIRETVAWFSDHLKATT